MKSPPDTAVKAQKLPIIEQKLIEEKPLQEEKKVEVVVDTRRKRESLITCKAEECKDSTGNWTKWVVERLTTP